MSIRRQTIACSLLILLGLIVGSALYFVGHLNRLEARTIAQRAQRAEQIVSARFALDAEELKKKNLQAANILAAMPVLKEASPTDPAVKGDLSNELKRFAKGFGLDFIELYDREGKRSLRASVELEASPDQMPSLVATWVTNARPDVILSYNQVYAGALAYVSVSPLPGGSDQASFIAVGRRLSSDFASTIKLLTGANYSLVAVDGSFFASSLDEAASGALRGKILEILAQQGEYRLDNGDLIYSSGLRNQVNDVVGQSLIQYSPQAYNATRSLMLWIYFALAFVLVALIMFGVVRYNRYLCQPLTALTSMINSIEKPSHLARRADEEGPSELVQLIRAVNKILEDLERDVKGARASAKASAAELKEEKRILNRVLAKADKFERRAQLLEQTIDTTVEQRLSHIVGEKEKIQALLDHIELGICTINHRLQVDGDFSQHMTALFGRSRQDIEGENIIDLVFKSSTVSKDNIHLVRHCLRSIIGEHEVVWELNNDNLVTEVEIQNQDGTFSYLALDWNPILDSEGLISKIMLIIRDITKQKRLEKELSAGKAEKDKMVAILNELVPNQAHLLRSFFHDAGHRLAAIKAELDGSLDAGKMFIELHTLKGAARSMSLSAIKDAAHLTEDLVDHMRKGEAVVLETLLERFATLCTSVQDYTLIYQNTLGMRKGSDEEVVPSILNAVIKNLPVMQKSLAKHELSIDSLICEDAVVQWKTREFEQISFMIMHALNNSLDHGYLLPGPSTSRQGQPIRFEVTATQKDGDVIIQVADHGAGINIAKVRALVIKKFGLSDSVPDATVLSYLFADNVSTAETVTDSSGRGSGLSAVKDLAEKLGGRVELGNRSDKHSGALLTVVLPADKVVEAPRAQRR